MIFLIFLTSCQDDNYAPKYTGLELIKYEEYMQDYNPPTYKWGYINTKGKLEIKAKYDDLREYNQGLAAVNKNGVWGFIDIYGTEVIEPRFKSVVTYNNGVAIGKDFLNKYHLFTGKGKLIADSLVYETIKEFSAGIAIVSKEDLSGYIDKKGTLKIDLHYQKAKPFDGMEAIVQKDQKYGIIDINDNTIIPLIYDRIWPLSGGHYRFKLNGKYGFLNLSKEPTFGNYANATDFVADHAIIHDGKTYKILHKDGSSKILPYSSIDVGGEGKWIYEADEKFGYLNNDGSILTNPNFDLVMRYKEGRASFSINDYWGYIDESGEILIPPVFPLTWDYSEGFARIIGPRGFGFMDKTGTITQQPQYMEVRDYSEGLARVQIYE